MHVYSFYGDNFISNMKMNSSILNSGALLFQVDDTKYGMYLNLFSIFYTQMYLLNVYQVPLF